MNNHSSAIYSVMGGEIYIPAHSTESFAESEAQVLTLEMGSSQRVGGFPSPRTTTGQKVQFAM
jgi:hypothetical protein